MIINNKLRPLSDYRKKEKHISVVRIFMDYIFIRMGEKKHECQLRIEEGRRLRWLSIRNKG